MHQPRPKPISPWGFLNMPQYVSQSHYLVLAVTYHQTVPRRDVTVPFSMPSLSHTHTHSLSYIESIDQKGRKMRLIGDCQDKRNAHTVQDAT